MKKITMIALAMFTAVGAGAQTIYDATNIAQKELNGTARFVGMGGAMGALGGDISTIGPILPVSVFIVAMMLCLPLAIQ